MNTKTFFLLFLCHELFFLSSVHCVLVMLLKLFLLILYIKFLCYCVYRYSLVKVRTKAGHSLNCRGCQDLIRLPFRYSQFSISLLVVYTLQFVYENYKKKKRVRKMNKITYIYTCIDLN